MEIEGAALVSTLTVTQPGGPPHCARDLPVGGLELADGCKLEGRRTYVEDSEHPQLLVIAPGALGKAPPAPRK